MVAGSLSRDLNQESNIHVVALANNARQAVEATTRHQPQVTVIDTELDGNGIKACQHITASFSTTAVLVISPFDWDIYLAQAWAVGAIGFITKCDTLDELLRFIWQAQRGKPLFTSEQIYRIQLWQQHIAPRLDTLTSREWEVLHLIVEGKSNREIANTLNLAESTVAKHITGLLHKTRLDSRHALISFANQQHITQSTQIPLSTYSMRRSNHLAIHRR